MEVEKMEINENIKNEADQIQNEETYGWKKFYKSGKLDAIGWAIIFFWGAIVLTTEILGYSTNFSWWNGWAVFFTGFGAMAIIGAIISVYAKDYDKAGWNFIVGFIMLGFSFGFIFNSNLVWVLVILAIGTIILVGAFIDKPNQKDWKKICFDGD
jgi:hypothetical protein